jgi:hypothetical protein
MITFLKKLLNRSVQNIMNFEDNRKSKKTKKKKTKKKKTKKKKDPYGVWEGNL